MSEEMEEKFYEKYFEYGGEETNAPNAKKALVILNAAYKRAAEITEQVMDGEVYDADNLAVVFHTIALSHKYATQFIASLPENEQDLYKKSLEKIIAQ